MIIFFSLIKNNLRIYICYFNYSEGKTLMDHSATLQLDMMSDDLSTIKSKITYIESNLGILRSDLISGKESLFDLRIFL